MPLPRIDQARHLIEVFEKCQKERAAAEDTILHPHASRVLDEQRKWLTARETARENYDNALAELKAFRKILTYAEFA